MKKSDMVALGIVTLGLLMLNYILISDLVALPGPIYGGDLYYQLGATNHVKYGGNPIVSPNTPGSSPVYFISYSFITGNIARIFNISATTSEFIFSYIIIILSSAVIFFLSKKLFNNYLIGIIGIMIYITAIRLPILKYTDFAYYVLMPLFLLLIYNFINKPDIRNSIFLGLGYGLIGLTHSISFIASSLLLLFVFIYYFAIKKLRDEKDTISLRTKETKNFRINDIIKIIKTKINFGQEILPYLIVLIIGVSLALIWWYKPVFVFHAETSPHYLEWNNGDWSGFKTQISFFTGTLKSYFFNVSGLKEILISLFNLLGLAGLFFIKSEKKEQKYIKFLLISGLIITFHYLLTQNIFGFNFVPTYISYLLLSPILLLLSLYGIHFGILLLKKANLKYIYVIFCLALIIILLVFVQYKEYKKRINDQWYIAGKNPIPGQLQELEKYLVKNSNVNDVILTTKEIGFAVNGLTGRKLLSSRRAHNDPFVVLDDRELAQAIILYGNNTALKKELIKKYNIKYLYWDYYWIQSEYYFDDQGRITGWFDPLLMFYSKDYEKTLKENNITYMVQKTWLDPAIRGEGVKQFDLLFVLPHNYLNITHPWKTDIDKYMTEVWANEYNGMKIAILYKVNDI